MWLGKALNRIAEANAATHLVALRGDPFWECVASALEHEGWNLTPLRRPERRGYVVYQIGKPE